MSHVPIVVGWWLVPAESYPVYLLNADNSMLVENSNFAIKRETALTALPLWSSGIKRKRSA